MKCPKCGYMSFDFNETCPKCRRNLVSEREKMNHPAFKPEPPVLLGALLRQTGDSGSFEVSEAAIITATHEGILHLEDTADKGPATSQTQEIDLDLPDLEFEKQEAVAEEPYVEVSTGMDSSPLDEEALSLELEDLLEAETPAEQKREDTYQGEEALTLEIEDVEPVEGEAPGEPAAPIIMAETEETFDSFSPGERELPEKIDELFSPDDLKEYKIEEYNMLTSLAPGKGERRAGSSGKKEVWDEISKDLEDLDFDIDEP